MKLLAIETATDACSVALYQDGEVLEDFRLAPRAHTQLILPMAEGLLQQAGLRPGDLDGLAFGRGPGAFTGVRIATAVIQGLAYALDRPVVAVSTLAALAQGIYREHGKRHLACAMDARMAEVYWGCYRLGEDGLMGLLGEERVCPPDGTPVLSEEDWEGCGSGWSVYADALAARHGPISIVVGEHWPHAQDVAALAAPVLLSGAGVSAAEALPVYLRDQVAHKKAG